MPRFIDMLNDQAKAEDMQALSMRGIGEQDADDFLEKTYWESPEPDQIAAGQQNFNEPEKAEPLAKSVTVAKESGQQGGIGIVPAIMAGLAGAFSDNGVATTSKLMKEWDPSRQEAVRVKREAAAGKATGEATARQRDLDMNDPESDLSARSRDFFTKNIPGAGVDGMSAADLKRFMPDIWKASGLEMRGAEFEESKRARGVTEGYREDELDMRQKRIDADREARLAKEQRAKDERQDKIDLKAEQYKTVGVKKVDTEFAKEYNDWTTGGRSKYEKSRTNLSGALEELNAAQAAGFFDATSGRVVGRAPDWARTQDAVALQQKVEDSVVEMLRATLGPQFTEAEGKRIIKLSYDPTLAPEKNIEKLTALIGQQDSRMEAIEEKVSYWEGDGRGSLKGWSGAPASAGAGGTVKVRSPDGKVGSIPAENLQRALAAGYTEI